jgi:hypothetical protein
MVTSEASFGKIRKMSAQPQPVSGIGNEAFTGVRPDGPQLWVLVKAHGTAGVMIGGAWTLDRAKALAELVVGLIM